MNGNVKFVKKQNRNNECMHVKCKSIVIVMWNNSARIKFHFYYLVTILWETIFYIFYSNEKVFYNFCCYTIDESVQTNRVSFSIKNLKGYVRKYHRFK
jgi:hypothetical protein